MSNLKHTPAPWPIEKCKCGDSACQTYHTTNGTFYQGSGYNYNDILLVAASPEMEAFIIKLLNNEYELTSPSRREAIKIIEKASGMSIDEVLK